MFVRETAIGSTEQMNVAGVSAAQLQEIQARYASHGRYASTHESVKTPDGSVTLSVASSGGGCMEPTYHYIRATDASGQNIYEHRNKGGDSYYSPAITPDGRTGFVVASHAQRNGSWKYQIKRINVKGGWIKGPQTVATVDYARSLGISPDGQMLALGVDKDVKTMRADIGVFGRLFGGGPTTLATLPENVESLAYLKDGSILAFPTHFDHACYLVKAGTPGAIRVPLAALSPSGYRETISQRLRFVKPEELDDFVAQAPWMVNDEGEVKTHVSAVSRQGAQAVVVGDGSAPQALWKWEGRQFVEVAKLPTAEAVGWNTSAEWSTDGSIVCVNHAGGLSVVDVASGGVFSIPGAVPSRMYARPGGQGIVGWASAENPVLWSYDGKGGVAHLATLSSGPPQDTPQAAFASDGRFVTWYKPQGAERAMVHVVAPDGACVIIPAADKVTFERDVLTVTLGDATHAVRIPADLATLDQQDWYQRACGSAVLGGKQPPKEDLKIDRAEDHVVIGGVEVPVRREAVAS